MTSKRHKEGTFPQIHLSSERRQNKVLGTRAIAFPHLYISSYRVTKIAKWWFEKKTFKKLYTFFREKNRIFPGYGPLGGKNGLDIVKYLPLTIHQRAKDTSKALKSKR